jgi:fibronectin type 3 domain-containing protein
MMSFRHHGLILLLFAVLFSLVQPAAAQNPSPPAYNPANGHWYQEFRTGGLTFQQAQAAAAGHSYGGYPGHLVTVTSPDEHQFLLTHVIRQGGEHWIGLYQDRTALDYREPDGGWRWITGEPYFWNHWHGEPNNAHGNEDVAVMRGTTGWNDLSYTDLQYGYIVEYEPQPFSGGVNNVRLTLSPNPVVGGQAAAGQLTLDQPTGVGGVVITLASSNPAAAVTPASVTVPAGAFTVSFPIITFPVAQATPVTISAVCLGIHASATLQVLPRDGLPALPPGQVGSTPVYNPANDHWYQLIRTPGELNWPDARAAAQSLSFAGNRGHLATITSAAERDFINTQLTGRIDLYAVWLGGYQDPGAPDYQEPDRGWRWVTGEPFQYTNWHPGEPNDSPRNSNALQLSVIWGGEWDDRLNNEARLPGYLVEYELLPGAPPVPPFGNLLVNGSFEDPKGSPHGLRNLPGWRMTRGTVDILTEPGWQAAHGQQMIDLVGTPGAATIEQSFPTEPGREYLFSGWISRNPEVSEGRANVYLNGQFFVQLYHREPGVIHRNMRWVPFAYRFRAVSPVTTLTLEDVTNLWDGGGGIFLDGLSVTSDDGQVPPPPGSPGPAPVYNPANGHWYQAVRLSFRVTWAEARVAAERLSFAGYRGHLATITSPEEDRFINTLILPGAGDDVWWLGGYQDRNTADYREPGGGWRWITGEPFLYTRWHAATGEPNDRGGEDVLDLAQGWGGDWNDESSLYGLPTYVVEYDPADMPPAALAAPTDLTATVISQDQVNLAWTDNSHNETGFAVYRREGSGPWVRIALLGPNVTRYADLDVRAGVVYSYQVQAIRDSELSAWSNEAGTGTPPVPSPPAARLLVSSHDTHSVLRFDAATGGLIDPFVPSGSGGLGMPHGLAIGPDGHLYVSNRQYHSILRYHGQTGAFIDAFVPARAGGLDTPIGLVFGPDGHLYVSSYGTNSILRYNGRTGAFLGAFVPSGQGGLRTPYGLMFGPDGHLYVASQAGSSVLRYDGRTGTFLGAFVPSGSGGLDGANGLVFGPDGHLYVSSWKSHSILRYEGRTGAFLGAFVPSRSGGLTEPWGLGFGPDGHLYVCSAGTDSVLRYDGRTGAFLGVFISGSGLQRPDWLLFVPSGTAPPPPPPPPPSSVPAAPSNLTARAVSHNRVDLAWKDNSQNETAFALWRKGGGPLTQSVPATSADGDWERIAVLPSNQTSFADRSVEPETAYVYRVRAIGKEGASDWSNEARATTPFDNGEPRPPGPPATPAGFKAQVISALEVRVFWARSIPGANGVGIWRRTGNGAWEKIAGPPAHALTYKDESVAPNTTYTYRARAHNDRGVSEWSNEVTVTTPPQTPVPVEQSRLSAPSDLVAQATAPDAVLLTWQDNSSDETAFAVYRRLGTGAQQRVGTAPANSTRFTDTTTLPGRRYYYQVQAYHNSAVSRRSSEATVATPVR